MCGEGGAAVEGGAGWEGGGEEVGVDEMERILEGAVGVCEGSEGEEEEEREAW